MTEPLSQAPPAADASAPPAGAPASKWGLLVSVVAIVLALLHARWPNHVDETVIVLVLLAVAPLILPLMSRYVSKFEGLGIKLELKELRREVQTARSKLDQLYLLSLGGKNVRHLKKLTRQGGYGRCYVGSALSRELEYLENLGYLEFKPPLKGLDNFTGQFMNHHVDNLSDHVQLTEAGRLFLQLRERSLERQGGEAPAGAQVPTEAETPTS